MTTTQAGIPAPMTRKQYAERCSRSEKTIRSWVVAVQIDPEKAAFSEAEVRLLDHVKTLLEDEGKTLAQVTEIIQREREAQGSTVEATDSPLTEMVEDLVGGAIDSIIPQLPHLMVQALSHRRHKIKAAFQQYFALAPSASSPIFDIQPQPEPSPEPEPQPPLQLPAESNGSTP